MPYIPQDMRDKFDVTLNTLPTIDTKGDLEYCIFKMMMVYIKDKEFNYKHLHDCTYSAMHCADEFRRRFLDAREDTALLKNGDIL